MTALKRIVGVLFSVFIAMATYATASWIAYDFGAEPKYIVLAGLVCGVAAGILASCAYFTGGSDD